ncbi:MAG TPA: DUF4190 domain-containing protein [Methylomirabilota bacterium]|nr:DUF4190 domain-containing protein [Methylomirabilota bacterium]
MYRLRAQNGQDYGPVDAATVRLWIKQRRADGRTLAQSDGGVWQPLALFPEFAADLTEPRPSRPPPLPRTQPPPRTSALAIAALVAGSLGFCTVGIGSLAGVVLGVLALVKIKRQPASWQGRGLALTGIVVSCATGLILLALGVMLPAISKSRTRHRQAPPDCAAQLRQLVTALRLYAADNSDMLPAATNWCDALQPHLTASTAFVCPADPGGPPCSFGFNERLSGREEGQINPRTVVFFEMNGSWNASGGPESIVSRHRGTYVIAFADGSVETLPASRLSSLRWDP